jgi:hypothetical protein
LEAVLLDSAGEALESDDPESDEGFESDDEEPSLFLLSEVSRARLRVP